jgi:FAD:protein FMN transferase
MRSYLILLALLLAGCAREPLYQTKSYVFGTLVEISIYGEEEAHARDAANHVLAEFQRLHHKFHAWDSKSPLSQINTAFAAGDIPIEIDAETAEILRKAQQLSLQSDHAFNPAIGHLIGLWGFHADTFKAQLPDEALVQAWVQKKPNMADLQINLGGFVKGYALDKAAHYLRSARVNNALVNIGGNIIALGKHGEKSWRVGIQHPRKPAPMAVLDLPSGWAIGTSGDYQRYFELGGKRFCHVINPDTGAPVQNIQSVTVLIPPNAWAGTISDVASKPIFIAPPEKREAVAARMEVAHFLIIDGTGRTHASPAMAKKLVWIK